jgi:hypothetical protein
MSVIQIKHRYSGKVLYECEAANVRICIESALKAGANLSGSDLSGSNLRGSDLSGSDLSWSNLRGSNLSGSDLRLEVIQFSGIGSMRRMTTYIPRFNEVHCGCFFGTIEQFAAQIYDTHHASPRHLNAYRAALTFLVEAATARMQF